MGSNKTNVTTELEINGNLTSCKLIGTEIIKNGLVSSEDKFISHDLEGVQEIIKVLESRLPRSGHPYNMAKMYEKFYPAIKVYSLYGSLSSDAIILLTTNREDYQQDIQISVPIDFKPSEEVRDAFANTKAIDWDNSAYMFTAIDRAVSPVILEVSTTIKGNATVYNPNLYFVLSREEAADLNVELKDEDKLEMKSLDTEEGIQFLVRRWKYSKPGTEEYVRRMVEKNPSIGLFSKSSGKVLSGIMTNANGLVGMLNTDPEERQKGYAVAVMTDLLKRMSADGFYPCSVLEEKNIASARFHEKVGMKFSHKCDYVFHTHSPFN